LNEFATAMQKAGFANKTVENIQDLLWSKLIVNVGINALTAVTRLKNGELIRRPDTEILLEKVVDEAVEVGKREGVKFIYEDPLAQVKKVCELTAANVSSMLQDVLRKKKTEIEFINGAIVERGARLGVPTPANEILTRLVRTIQSTYDIQQA
jgi:2-dehydropantoate 2-reductase